jgi:GNAT superfamily N-acetyltransferase
MEIEYSIHEGDRIPFALAMIEKNYLYLGGLNLSMRYSGICKIIDHPYIYNPLIVSLAKLGDKYIGCAILLKNPVHTCNTCTYVDPEFRRKGIGSNLILLVAPPSQIKNYQHPIGFPKIS